MNIRIIERMKNVKAVILAAGEGIRMESSVSKLIHHIYYQSLVEFPARACIESGIDETIVVVGYQADRVKNILGKEFTYVYQKKRLGTGDALRQAIPLLKDFKGELVVLAGDKPFITSSLLIKLVHHHRKSGSTATVVTALMPDPEHYGRVIRNGYFGIKKIVESKDANPDEIKVKEVNSSIYCFDTQKLLPLLPQLNCNNAKKEYYLTDVISLFNQKGLRVEALRVDDPTTILGVNTKKDLQKVIQIMKKRKING